MLVADARTNPYTYRHCTHIHATTDRPSRCLACGAIDHGPVPHYDPDPLLAVLRIGGTAGYRVGAEPGNDEKPQDLPTVCPVGHAMTIQRGVYPGRGEFKKSVCNTCRELEVQRKLSEPCANGHVGQRFVIRGYTVRCRVCHAEKQRLVRQARAASITRAFSEAAHA